MKKMYKTTFNLNNRSVVSTTKVVTLVYTVLHSKSHHSITTRECSENQSFLVRKHLRVHAGKLALFQKRSLK